MRLRFQKLLANLNNLAHSMGTGAFLSAAKADDLKKKHPEQASGIEYLAEQDPTSTKKYLEWSVKMLLTGADYLVLAEAVKKYNTLLPRLEGKDRDINSFPSLRDLKDTIEKTKKKETKGDVKKNGAMNTEERLSAAVEAMHAIKASPSVLLAMEEAVELLSAANVGGLDRNHATTVMIPVPKHLAARFPGVEHNNGHEPHLTVCFLSADKDMTAGKASEALAIIRKVCRRQAPFRVALDVNTGLHDFGPSEMGSKALWFNVRQDPNDVLDKLHRAIKNSLKLEGIPVDSRNSFQPHVTWRYISNDQSEGDRQRMSAFAASRFNDLTTVWFDVRHLILSMPDGSQKAIALSPRLR